MQKINISLSRTYKLNTEDFLKLLFDYDLMSAYQIPPLVSYELKKGKLLENDALVFLYYDEEKTKVIKETIINNNLPNSILINQQYNDVSVLIKHTFKNNIWHLDYTFTINNNNPVNKLGLAKQLTEDMESFLKIT